MEVLISCRSSRDRRVTASAGRSRLPQDRLRRWFKSCSGKGPGPCRRHGCFCGNAVYDQGTGNHVSQSLLVARGEDTNGAHQIKAGQHIDNPTEFFLHRSDSNRPIRAAAPAGSRADARRAYREFARSRRPQRARKEFTAGERESGSSARSPTLPDRPSVPGAGLSSRPCQAGPWPLLMSKI